jgi:hypothetical protein
MKHDTKTNKSMPLRLEWRTPGELDENPHNWREHSEAQMAALTDVMDEVGWAGACLYNEQTGRLIDGHARRKLALGRPDEIIPVLVGNWDEATEKKILATLDPLAAMAKSNAAQLDALLRDIDTGSEETQQMLANLAADCGLYQDTADASEDEAIGEEGPTPRDWASVSLSDRYAILIPCADESEQRNLLGRLTKEGIECRALIV